MGWFQLYCKNCGWELEPNAACAVRNGCPGCGKHHHLFIRLNPQRDRHPRCEACGQVCCGC